MSTIVHILLHNVYHCSLCTVSNLINRVHDARMRLYKPYPTRIADASEHRFDNAFLSYENYLAPEYPLSKLLEYPSILQEKVDIPTVSKDV